MNKVIQAPNEHDPSETKDHRVITGTDLVLPSGNLKRGLDIKILEDAAARDAFGRVRTSDTSQRLDVEFLYDKQPDYFDEVTNNGTVTLNGNTRDLTLSLGDANDGSFAKMSSYPVPYTPGNSQLVDITGVLDLAGIGSGQAEVFLRSSISGAPVDLTTLAQSEWKNLSGVDDIDWTKSHIFSMDFQSLKVGTIRFAIVQSGVFVPIAQFNNDNVRDSGYWQLANGSVFYKIYNTATETIMEVGYGNENNAIGFRYTIASNASATMKAICCTVKSEGGQDLRDMAGLPRSIDLGITPKTVSTTLIPLLSIRTKTTFQTYENLILTIPKAFNVSTDNPIRLVILHDTILTGAVWVDVDSTDSCIEYDLTASAASNGHIVFSEYVASATRNTASSESALLGKTVLWNKLSAQTGIYTIAAVRTGGQNASVLCGVQWEELR